jgi:hypothetical protein
VLQAANGQGVEVVDLPTGIDYPTDHSRFVDAFIFEPYSLNQPCACSRQAPGSSSKCAPRSISTSRPTDVQVTCRRPGRGVLVSSSVAD